MSGRCLLAVAALHITLLGGCGGLFQPDTYEGAGAWRRGDGSVYRGNEPVPVLRSEALSYARRTEREHEQVFLTLALDLANGEILVVDLAGHGLPGETIFLVGERAASSGAVYALTVGLSLGSNQSEDRARVSVVCRGPLRYEAELRL